MRLALLTVLLTLTAALPVTLQAQWDIQASHTTASLRGIHALGHGVAWASGTEGTVLRTTDDGTTWQTCPTPPAAEHLDFRGIQAFDENTAIVMSSGKGDLSRLYKTTDACQSWKLVFTNPDSEGFWDAIRFRSKIIAEQPPPDGILIGDPVEGRFAIFYTTNGGETWKRWGRKGLGWGGSPCGEREAKSKTHEAMFAASNATLLVGDTLRYLFATGGSSGSRLFFSDYSGTDYGFPCKTSFDKQALPFAHSESAGAFAVASTPWSNYMPSVLVLVGGDYKKPDDSTGSATYLLSRHEPHPFLSEFIVGVPEIPPHGYRSAVAYSPDHKAWITVGPNGTDLSTDDGKNWRALKPGPTEPPTADRDWNALSLPFVVGPKGRIGRLRPDALPKATK